MTQRSPDPSPKPLVELAEETLDCVRTLRPSLSPRGLDARGSAVVFLETKVLPELRQKLALPVFVGVQGGTNTGKSTVFNALAGKLLSPAVVVAAATKHPLVYAHERWRATFLGSGLLTGTECVELSDPKELISDSSRTDLLYFRFHADDRLEDLALLDSPDFDSSLETNALQAGRIAAISDVSLFVTTAQKYRDLRLLEELVRLVELKSRVVVLFNMVEEHVVFETLWDDLKAHLPTADSPATAVRLPPIQARYPEEELEGILSERVLTPLSLLKGSEIKPRTVARTLARLLALLRRVASVYAIEVEYREEITSYAESQGRVARADYGRETHLSFPEETVAIRSVLSRTELGTYLQPSPEVQRHSQLIALGAGLLRKFTETSRRVLVRLSHGDEGWIDSSPESLREYAASRDQSDVDVTARLADALRLHVENLVREKEHGSALAGELVRSFFTGSFAADFAKRVRSAHSERLRSATDTGAEWVPSVQSWLRDHPTRVHVLSTLAVGLKLGIGLLLAWALPPSLGLLGVLSPLKWLTFAAGYFLGAYAVSLVVCLSMRRKRRFLQARRRHFEATLEDVLEAPLAEALGGLVDDSRLRRLESLADEMSRHPDLKALGQSHPAPGDGTERDGGPRATAP